MVPPQSFTTASRLLRSAASLSCGARSQRCFGTLQKDRPLNHRSYCCRRTLKRNTQKRIRPGAKNPGRRSLRGRHDAAPCYTRPAFLSVKNAPRFFIVFRPFADTRTVTFLPSSGMKRVFVWRLTWRRRLPVGLNLVALTRLEYPPPT